MSHDSSTVSWWETASTSLVYIGESSRHINIPSVDTVKSCHATAVFARLQRLCAFSGFIFDRASSTHLIMLMRVVLLVMALAFAESQRPPYAGSSNRYPVVLPRFREEQQNSTLAAAPSSGVDNRLGTSNTNVLANVPVTTSTIPPDLPIDAHGDLELVNRIKTWPRDKQPFWYINWKQIQEHRGADRQPAQQQTQQF